MMAKSDDETPDIEYSIEVDQCDCLFDYTSNHLSVIGKMKGPVRYNLNTLMKSDAPKHKEILKSLIVNTVQNNLYGGFKCLLHKSYQISPLNNDNQTALHLAFYYNASNIITEFEDFLKSEYCKEQNQSDYTDKNGLTHLHVACAMGDIKLIDMYSKNSANINSRFVSSSIHKSHYNGFTPLHFVMINSDNQSKEMVQLLIERGADINAVDSIGRTPLHIVSSFSNSKSYWWFRNNIVQVMEALIDHKINVNIKDAAGDIPLFEVLSSLYETWYLLESASNYKKVIQIIEQKLKLLLEAGSDVNAKNNNNDTILHCAVNNLKLSKRTTFEFEDSKIIQSLEMIMSYKPDIDMNVKNNNDKTPLLIAVSYLSLEIVQFLLKNNVDPRSLKFDHKSHKFFKSDDISTPKSFKNLIAILDLLIDKGFVPKPEDKLALLKFLIPKKGRSVGYDDFKSANFHIMCLESPERLKNLLDNFYIDFRNDFMEYHENSEEYLDHFDHLHEYIASIEAGNVFMDQNSKKLIKKTLDKCKALDHSWSPRVESDEIAEELDELESIELPNGEFMADALMEKPGKSAQYSGINNFDEHQLDNFRYFDGIMEGYVSVCLVRHYVFNLSYDIVKNLHCTPLPYLCYEFIINHLSNIDILNLCVAILT